MKRFIRAVYVYHIHNHLPLYWRRKFCLHVLHQRGTFMSKAEQDKWIETGKI